MLCYVQINLSCSCLCILLNPFPSARQHPSYGDCLEVKKEYYQNCYVLDCVTQCSQSAAHLYEQFLQVQQIGFVTLGPLCRYLPDIVQSAASRTTRSGLRSAESNDHYTATYDKVRRTLVLTRWSRIVELSSCRPTFNFRL